MIYGRFFVKIGRMRTDPEKVQAVVEWPVPPNQQLQLHPQSNEQTERANQELKAALHCVASRNQSLWTEQLLWIEYVHNSHTSTATASPPLKHPWGTTASASHH